MNEFCILVEVSNPAVPYVWLWLPKQKYWAACGRWDRLDIARIQTAADADRNRADGGAGEDFDSDLPYIERSEVDAYPSLQINNLDEALAWLG